MSRHPDEHVGTSGRFALLAFLLAAVTGWAIYDELVVRRPWKEVQATFNRLAAEREMPPTELGIRQVTNHELAIADRCPTCHVGIERPALDDSDVPQPFRAHPGLDDGLLVAHPPSVMGCTVCHGGQGMQTKGVAGAVFDHGRDDPFWETPLLRGATVESSCFGCHSVGQVETFAPTFAEGRRLYEDLGCQACHESRLVAPSGPTVGPALDLVRLKHSPEALVRWIRAPEEIRPHTRMPNSWPEPRSPQGAPLPDDHPDEVAWRQARETEPRAIAAFLFSLTRTASVPEVEGADLEGDARRGEELYRALGCPACHEEMGGRIFGPELAAFGATASDRWLHAWLDDPRAVWAAATMPDFRLSERERIDLVAHLRSIGEHDPPAAVDGHADRMERPPWPPDPDLIERGEALVRELGCHGCHEIPGFAAAGQAGPTLLDYGVSTPDQLDWGEATPPSKESPLPAWTRIKVSDPRRFRRAGVSLVMPKYRLTEAETEALTVFVLADRPRQPAAFHAPEPVRQRSIARGEHLIGRLGCRTCHEIGRTEERHLDDDGTLLWVDDHPRGGDVRKLYEDRHFAPPTLTYGGLKLQYRWWFEYMRAPYTVRRWLPGRMPTYDLTSEQSETLIAYFAAVDAQAYPFRDLTPPPLSAADREDAMWLFTDMKCLKCHGRDPSDTDPGDSAEAAPDLAEASVRLTPAWVRRWLLGPQRLEPGTRMPTFFPLYDDDDPTSYTTPYPDRLGGDVFRQVDALVALTLAYGTDERLAQELQKRLQGVQR